ncbi:glycosyl transferase [Intrasporangium oryzae NRRL B-24470]|uniref:D-inositol 3-phosphate glycosyltransferase n=1 Tax=Intrasporangium oryzae NRRL B-24470 TaxID=1386089 RepID=W9G4H0_9MICO|nr:glycosyl transferase [Intrasporangium oryzae NRRL B-24470]
MRIAVIGPTHPHKGGVAAHTTMLAHHLADAGHHVTLVSWAHLYPSRLRRADVVAPAGVPEVPPFPRTVRALSWARPGTWLGAGRRLRAFDTIVVVHSIPSAAPALLALLRAAGATPGSAGPRPQSIVVCHAVLPLEHHAGDARLVGALLSHVDATLVHSADQARLANDLGARRVWVADLPPHVPGGDPISREARPGPVRLLALGLVRDHKGFDVLLGAMRDVPGVTLTIAGELWGDTRATIGRLVVDPRLAGRIEIREGYVPADALAALLADHDVLALPYRSSTASQNVVLAHAHGLPVLATDVPPFSDQVEDGVNGLLVPPDDEAALAAALRRLTDPEVRRTLAEGVHTPDLSGSWASYLGTIEALSVDESALTDPDAHEPYAAPSQDEALDTDDGLDLDGAYAAPSHVDGPVWSILRREAARHAGSLRGGAARLRHVASRAVSSRRPVLDLRPEDLPHWVLATDVLGDPDEADDARRLARLLGLPRSLDSVSAWAALGALAAIVRVRDDGRRSAVIVDETGTRSLLSRWARAVGFAPVEIEFTGAHPSVAALDVDAGSLDVIVRIHPRGCDGTDVDQVIEQAAWALRPGGLLIVTVPIGPPGAHGAVGPADVRAVIARGHDLGFVLVGELDGDVTARMRDAAVRARADDAAYGLVRLTLRKR